MAMDVAFQLHGQLFEWDAEKAASNFRKHGVSFEKACEIFFDCFVKTIDATDGDEVREAAIGMTEDLTLLVVVHVESDDDVIRIISARRADAKERREYESD